MQSLADDIRSPSPIDKKPSSSSSTLAKGKACLECRRRKVRCNANQPCGGCIRMKKEEYCIYEDEVERVRRLQSRVTELEERLKQLQTSSSSRTESPSDEVLEGKGKEKEEISSDSSQIHRGSTSEPTLDFAGDWWKADPPPDIQAYLIHIFFDRATPKSGFRLNQERFIQSLKAERELQPHPALLNVIYLLACYFSEIPALTRHQQVFMTRTRHYMGKSLAQKDRLINFVAASTLLAYYLLRVGRFLECAHEISNAARFAMFCNLHKISSSVCKPPVPPPPSTALPETIEAGAYVQPLIPPPKDAVELGERISLFWTVVLLDHSGSLVTGLPPNIPYQEIETVWPRALEDYEQGQVSNEDESPGSLFDPNANSGVESETTKHRRDTMKSIVLLGRVTSFATSAVTYPVDELKSPVFLQVFRIHEDAIVRFAKTQSPSKFLPTPSNPPITSFSPGSQLSPSTHSSPSFSNAIDSPGSNSNPTSPISDTRSIPSIPPRYRLDPFFLIRTYVYISFIHLYNAVHRGQTEVTEHLPGAYEARLKQARHVITDIRDMSAHDIDISQLPMMLGFAWCSVAHVLAQHVRKLQAKPATNEADLEEAKGDFLCVASAIRALCDPFPILKFQLDRLQVYGIHLESPA
ncbi:hypothetical protein FRC02_006476 [Tulasnella sp. 418]|nr:hypothetical protein FRC02_006476 [Tulasnella sp. 418]